MSKPRRAAAPSAPVAGSNPNEVAPFIQELWDIVENGEGGLVGWTASGQAFVVHDCDKFASTVLEKRFKSANFSSFVRQLNYYSFRKEHKASRATGSGGATGEGGGGGASSRAWTFSHIHFIRDRHDLLPSIRRKTAQDYSQRSEVDTLRGEVDELRASNGMLRTALVALHEALLEVGGIAAVSALCLPEEALAAIHQQKDALAARAARAGSFGGADEAAMIGGAAAGAAHAAAAASAGVSGTGTARKRARYEVSGADTVTLHSGGHGAGAAESRHHGAPAATAAGGGRRGSAAAAPPPAAAPAASGAARRSSGRASAKRAAATVAAAAAALTRRDDDDFDPASDDDDHHDLHDDDGFDDHDDDADADTGARVHDDTFMRGEQHLRHRHGDAFAAAAASMSAGAGAASVAGLRGVDSESDGDFEMATGAGAPAALAAAGAAAGTAVAAGAPFRSFQHQRPQLKKPRASSITTKTTTTTAFEAPLSASSTTSTLSFAVTTQLAPHHNQLPARPALSRSHSTLSRVPDDDTDASDCLPDTGMAGDHHQHHHDAALLRYGSAGVHAGPLAMPPPQQRSARATPAGAAVPVSMPGSPATTLPPPPLYLPLLHAAPPSFSLNTTGNSDADGSEEHDEGGGGVHGSHFGTGKAARAGSSSGVVAAPAGAASALGSSAVFGTGNMPVMSPTTAGAAEAVAAGSAPASGVAAAAATIPVVAPPLFSPSALSRTSSSSSSSSSSLGGGAASAVRLAAAQPLLSSLLMLMPTAQPTTQPAAHDPGMTIDAAHASGSTGNNGSRSTGSTALGGRAQLLATPPPVPSASASRSVSASSASFPCAGQQHHHLDAAGAGATPGSAMAIDAASGATPMLAALEGMRLAAGSAATVLLSATQPLQPLTGACGGRRRRASGAASAHGGDMMVEEEDDENDDEHEETAAAPAPLAPGQRASSLSAVPVSMPVPVPAIAAAAPPTAAGGAPPMMGGTGSLLFARQMSFDYAGASAPAALVRPASLDTEAPDTGRTHAGFGNMHYQHHNPQQQTLAPPTPLSATALSLPHALAAASTIPVAANRYQPGGHLQVLQQQGSGIGSELTPVLLLQQQQQVMLPGAPVAVGTAAAAGLLPPPPLRPQQSFFVVAPRASPSSSTAVTPMTARAPMLATPNAAAAAATGGATAVGPVTGVPFAATGAVASASFGIAAACATTTTTVMDSSAAAAAAASNHHDNDLVRMRSAVNRSMPPAAQKELVGVLVAGLCPVVPGWMVATAAPAAASAGVPPAPLSPRTASTKCRRVLAQVLAKPGIAALCAGVPECSHLAAGADTVGDAAAALKLFCTVMPADVVLGALLPLPDVNHLLTSLTGLMAPLAMAAARVATAVAAATASVVVVSQQQQLRLAATAAASNPAAIFAHA